MQTLIIEDELPAAQRLQFLLKQCDPAIEIKGFFDSVETSVQWLSANPSPDLILLDIHLADGSAFEIFRKTTVAAPIIFTTAYDQYAMDAFQVLSVDYLLKPVTSDSLSYALQKLKQFRQTSTTSIDYSELASIIAQAQQSYKRRFMGKVGSKLFFIHSADVICFMADNKIVYLFDREGNRYVIEQKLELLETMLDPTRFFRVNRSVIVSAFGITQVKPYLNGRLKIQLKACKDVPEIIVSRERVNDFKKWADS
jgi:DNA-binding LytR/AlgR family response regulator